MTTKNQIAAKYHAELTGALGILRDKVMAGEMSPKQFLAAQKRLNRTYKLASK